MLAVTDVRIPAACRHALITRGFRVITLPPFSALDPRVASHPDMLILPLLDRLFVHKAYYEEARNFIDEILVHTNLRLTLTEDTVNANYPFDISLNLAAVGKLLIGRRDRMANAVVAFAENNGFSVCDAKQGYAKCAAVPLGDTAIITADPSVEKTGRAASLDVLRIREGFVALDGYDHGFIGGASGVYQNTVFFCGDLTAHPDANEIQNFCHRHGFDAVSLSNDSLYDVGTIFFF